MILCCLKGEVHRYQGLSLGQDPLSVFVAESCISGGSSVPQKLSQIKKKREKKSHCEKRGGEGARRGPGKEEGVATDVFEGVPPDSLAEGKGGEAIMPARKWAEKTRGRVLLHPRIRFDSPFWNGSPLLTSKGGCQGKIKETD